MRALYRENLTLILQPHKYHKANFDVEPTESIMIQTDELCLL